MGQPVMKISYRKKKKWKYSLDANVRYATGIVLDEAYAGVFLSMDIFGLLFIKAGYHWDGPSGPTIDTKTFMPGSLVHDALYQLMREGVLPQSARKRCDEILKEICIEDGMNRLRAWSVYRGVRLGGGKARKPDLLTAP